MPIAPNSRHQAAAEAEGQSQADAEQRSYRRMRHILLVLTFTTIISLLAGRFAYAFMQDYFPVRRFFGHLACLSLIAGTVLVLRTVRPAPRLAAYTVIIGGGLIFVSELARIVENVFAPSHPLVVGIEDVTIVLGLVGLACSVNLALFEMAVHRADRFRETDKRLRSQEIQFQFEKRYRSLFEAASDAILVLNDGRIADANPAALSLFEAAREEMPGLPFLQLSPPNPNSDTDTAAAVQARLEAAQAGQPQFYEWQLCRLNGTSFDAEVTLNRVALDESPHVLAIVRDVSERRRMELELRQAHKMEAIGVLAGGIAHDFNNILSTVLGNLEAAREDAPAAHAELQESLSQAMKAVLRGRDLVAQILAFSRQSAPERKPLQLNGLVKEVAKLVRATIPTTIEMNVDVCDEPVWVYADAIQVHQVLMNLCTNACHAMRETGGRLQIDLGPFVPPTPPVPAPPDRQVRLTVRDTGCGMTASVLERIFEPFFTTKPVGEGSGMGLAVVDGIVKGHGGYIRVTSKPGHGSTFDVFLPLTEEQDVEAANIEESPLAQGGGQRILFVDDEVTILTIVRRRLPRHGYEVVTKQNSLEALQTFLADPHAFDVIITDQTMPGMTGMEMAKTMLRLRPELPIILCTGYSDHTDEAVALKAGIAAFLPKPASVRDIAHTIQHVLARTPPPTPED